MYKLISSFCLFLFIGLSLSAQQSLVSNYLDEARLNTADVPKFLETFKPILEDINALGHKLSGSTSVAQMEGLKGQESVQQILNKYGWDETYYEKLSIIMLGYAQIKVEEEFNKMSADQKKMMKQMGVDYEKMNYVHPDDLSLISPSFSKIDALLKEVELEAGRQE